MVAFNFQPQFVEAIKSGRKCQTIRKIPKKQPPVGAPVHLFTGQRTPACRKIGYGNLANISKILVHEQACLSFFDIDDNFVEALTLPDELDEYARRDGFESFKDMRSFFDYYYSLPFYGVIYEWKLAEHQP